jgi:putative ABC transport system permease protein
MLVPSYFASKTTIVIHKQNKKSKKNIPFWKKYFLDVVLIGISIYGIYSYNLRQNMMNYSTGTLTELPIDPLLFLVSTFFILGCGLLFLRIYPYIIKFVFWCGKKIWSPAAYASLLSVSRSGGRDQFLILFLIFTLSIGIFNAKAARTINTNSDEKAEYSIGADVTLLAQWKNNSVSTSVSIPGNGAAVPSASTSTSSGDLEYYEPDYYQYQHLAGVDLSTKVMVKDTASVNIDGKSSEGVNFMAIIPDEFGKIAWFRNDLLPYHWYNYLNLMTKDSRAMLLSRSMQKKYNIKLGDYITVYLGNSTSVTGMAYAFVDYWPTYNPHKDKDGKYQDMVIANFNYLEQTLPITPYEVWIKKKTNATSQALYDDIKKKDLKIQEINDTSQQVIKNRNNPILQGVNGALTLGFMVTMVITAVGFLIYWIMSIRNRILQFGILRAMGLRLSELIQMLVLEQMLISLVAILIGAVIGSVTGNIFVPMLKLAFSTSDQVPPFKVMAYTGDYIKIYVIVAAIIAIGLIVIGRFVAKIKIAQAIKLGED